MPTSPMGPPRLVLPSARRTRGESKDRARAAPPLRAESGRSEPARVCRPRPHCAPGDPPGTERTPLGDRGARKSRTHAVWARGRARSGTAGGRGPSRPGQAAAALRASAAERRLHLAQRLEVLVEPVDVLLHLDDARAELRDGAERAALLARLLHDVAELGLGAPLPERAAQVAGAEDAGQREDTQPAAYSSLHHPVLLARLRRACASSPCSRPAGTRPAGPGGCRARAPC